MVFLSENQGAERKRRAGVYIDGFNLYHPVHAYGEPFLKWIDLWRLSDSICQRTGDSLTKVAFCTAVPEAGVDLPKHTRHIAFNNAQRAMGVTIFLGHHVTDPDGKRTEKQSDINVALALILDAEDDLIDSAYILSADSDQAATAIRFRERFPEKRLYGIAPPTKTVPRKVINEADDHFVLSKLEIETCVMPMYVMGKTGNPIRRPTEYDPPAGWVHPDNRPRKAR